MPSLMGYVTSCRTRPSAGFNRNDGNLFNFLPPNSEASSPFVRTMVFTPDFSLLFCLTHFTFVNFSYPYDTNLFSYLPFYLKLCFHSDRSHHEERVKGDDQIQKVVVQTKKTKLLSSNDEGRTLHRPRIKSSSHSKPLFFMTTLFPLRALHPMNCYYLCQVRTKLEIEELKGSESQVVL